jgi:hypothetical protein
MIVAPIMRGSPSSPYLGQSLILQDAPLVHQLYPSAGRYEEAHLRTAITKTA